MGHPVLLYQESIQVYLILLDQLPVAEAALGLSNWAGLPRPGGFAEPNIKIDDPGGQFNGNNFCLCFWPENLD